MAFEKGREKTGGRKTGSTNRATLDIKSKIAALIDNQFDSIEADLEALEPKDRVAAYLKFMEYVVPKQREHHTKRYKHWGQFDYSAHRLIDHLSLEQH